MTEKEIYFDNSATTRPSKEVLTHYLRVADEEYGNPSSKHKRGQTARALLTEARKTLLSALGAKDGHVFFTAGGTEANNLALFGRAYAKERFARGCRIITTAGEHASVALPLDALAKAGFDIVHIPTVGGALDTEALLSALSPKTVLISMMAVNNETGAIYPTSLVSAAMRRACPNAVLHVDATQAFMKIPMTPKTLGADMITVSSHKIEGPKGVGALWVSDAVIKNRGLAAVTLGGGQEEGLRSGTENVPAISAFAEAARLALASFDERTQKIREVKGHLLSSLALHPVLADAVTANLPEKAAPHILSLTVEGFKSETVLNDLSGRGIYVSSGSACASHARNLSAALLAFGKSEEETDATIRLSFSHHNTKEEADVFLSALAEIVETRARVRR